MGRNAATATRHGATSPSQRSKAPPEAPACTSTREALGNAEAVGGPEGLLRMSRLASGLEPPTPRAKRKALAAGRQARAGWLRGRPIRAAFETPLQKLFTRSADIGRHQGHQHAYK